MAKEKTKPTEPTQAELELETNQYGRIRRIDIDVEMKQAYLSYSMSVIVARALPDARDGLKPVQRRILYVMHDTGLRPETPYRKSARIVGDVLGKYHPHGDMSVYDAMARMAQDFSMRYLIVDGQGNFGSVDGDPPAAMRYTEARLSKPAVDLLADLDKNTVTWQDNYDGTQKEPTVVPAGFPNLIVNGATGIAVGMATNIPPHNLGEIVDATVFMLERMAATKAAKATVKPGEPMPALPEPDVDVDELIKFGKGVHRAVARGRCLLQRLEQHGVQVAGEAGGQLADHAGLALAGPDRVGVQDVDELIKFVKGPDFPTGAIAFRYNDAVEGGDAIKATYATGRGKIIVQAKAHIEEGTRGRNHIIVTELPYAVNKSSLIERIADLARDEKITGMTDIRDESDRRGMRIVIDINKNDDPRKVLAALYKYTVMRSTFGVIMLALVPDATGRLEPRVLPLRRLLHIYIEHRREIVRRRSEFDLAKALERAHILEGLVRALDMIDRIVKLIRASRDTEIAQSRIICGHVFWNRTSQGTKRRGRRLRLIG